MMIIEAPSGQPVTRLQGRGLAGYLRVGLIMPWANMEEALAQVDVNDLTPAAVQAFLDLPDGGATKVGS
jgi:hypothetical protein